MNLDITKSISIFLLLVLPIFALNSKSSFEKRTLESSLSIEEKRQLDLLFSKLFLAQHFGYTLLGDKPVSVSGQFDQLPAGNCEIGAHTYIQEWKTWDRIKKQIQLKNFLLIRLPDFSVPHFNSITFVNKKAFVNCVRKNIDLFQARLGQQISPELLLSEVEKEERDLYEILGRDETLYGILLGYGRNNSLLHHRKMEILAKTDRLRTQGFSLQWPRVRTPYNSLEGELEELGRRLVFQGEEEHLLSRVYSVHFGGIPDDPETLELNKKYKGLRKNITAFYSNGEIFANTLRVLTGS